SGFSRHSTRPGAALTVDGDALQTHPHTHLLQNLQFFVPDRIAKRGGEFSVGLALALVRLHAETGVVERLLKVRSLLLVLQNKDPHGHPENRACERRRW